MPEHQPRVIYIAGFARSGSTLLGEMIGAPDGAFHTGELLVGLRRLAQNKVWSCSCGAEVQRCGVWGDVLEPSGELTLPSPERAQVLDSLVREPLLRYRRPTAQQLDMATTVSRLYQRIARVTGATTIVDSSKSPLLGRLVGAEMVHLVRDPRAVVHSRNRGARRRGRLTPGHPAELRSIVADARRWSAVNRAQRTSERTALLVRYEDLVSSNWSPNSSGLHVSMESFVGRTQTAHLIWGNRSFRRAVPRDVQVDDSWKKEMPRWQRTLVASLTTAELRHYPLAADKGPT